MNYLSRKSFKIKTIRMCLWLLKLLSECRDLHELLIVETYIKVFYRKYGSNWPVLETYRKEVRCKLERNSICNSARPSD